ncbi:hypothetical protein OH77DRAFT_1515924 [Trametes cingulata]|nr:hypothetical protein OH77DRAFT_1515924 [Trametes cingulata]
MSTKFAPTPQELALVNQIFALADPQKLGVVTGDAAVKVFGGTKLPPSVLAEVWNIADEDNNGVLTRKGVAVAVRLLGHAQRGERVSEALVNKPGPIPTIEGLPPVPTPSSMGISPAKSPPPGLPPLTPQDKSKFLKLFLGCHPVNGLLPGEKARDVFVKSKLPVDKLSQIWNLADTKNRGALDATDFTIAMYLIQACMSGQLQTIPATLPPSVYEQAANGVVPQATGDSGHISPSLTGGFPARPVQQQYTGQALSSIQPQMTGQTFSSIQPQMTGQMRGTPNAPPLPARSAAPASPAFPFLQQAPSTANPQWDVTPQEKANSDRIFDGLDTQKKGYIEGDVAVPFMLQSKLPEDVLAQIWDLADLNNDGRLTRDGFAVAMHLIQGKLAGKDIPSALPLSLIPPALRGSGSALAGSSQPPVPEAIKDLLWDDSPPASATAPTHSGLTLQPQATGSMSPRPAPTMSPPPRGTPVPAPAPATDPFASGPFGGYTAPAASTPHKDLLGDDDEPHASSPPLQDKSAEIGNVKNQLSSTNRSLETAKSERETLERQLTEQAALLASLQTQLSSAKAAYDTETRLLGALKDRFAAQSAEIQKTREELIHAESDLSATRVEKAEVEGALLRDKEEVRDLHRKMSEVGAQIEATKAEVEKLKKEAKQQKGLLAIAKKQLATREAEKAKADKELEEARAELQEITKEREEAEAQLNKEEPPAQLSNGHVSPPLTMPSPDPSLIFAAAQPLPTSPEVSPPASVIGKSTNPFERLAMSGSPRPESPFLPFAASSAMPTPPTAPAAAQEGNTDADDPFGFKAAEEPQAPATEPQTPKPASPAPTPGPAPLVIGSPKQQEFSPADTDLFTTPPTTATGSDHVVAPQPEQGATSRFPPLEDDATEESAQTPKAPPQNPPPEAEDTDLTHQLKEIEESDSDSSSDEDEDNEPLGSIKAKLTHSPEKQGNGAPAASGTSAFDDSFGISSEPSGLVQASLPQQGSYTETPPGSSASRGSAEATEFATMFEVPAISREPPESAPIPAIAETAKPNGTALSPSAGVSEFDQALGKLPSLESSTASSQFTNVTFDSAFDDNFDFAAASAAVPAATATNGASSSDAAAAFPPPPTAATTSATRGGNSFDDVFGTTGSVAAAPAAPAPVLPAATFSPPAQASAPSSAKPLSFDDAFGATNGAASTTPNLAASTSTQSNGGFSFDDAFGGNDEALALDTSFTSQTPHYQPPPGQPPSKTGQTPFPTSSAASSPRGSSSTQPSGRRSSSPVARISSPTPRHASPPPRHSSPKPRPGTGDSSKEKAAATRHNRLSIRLPFGRKKKHHDAPPVPPLAQQQIVEDPTPAVEDDVEAVKTLCGMGFSRTQAVTALEEHGYDVQRALNSLLGTQ